MSICKKIKNFINKFKRHEAEVIEDYVSELKKHPLRLERINNAIASFSYFITINIKNDYLFSTDPDKRNIIVNFGTDDKPLTLVPSFKTKTFGNGRLALMRVIIAYPEYSIKFSLSRTGKSEILSINYEDHRDDSKTFDHSFLCPVENKNNSQVVILYHDMVEIKKLFYKRKT